MKTALGHAQLPQRSSPPCRGMPRAKAPTLGPRSVTGIAAGAATLSARRPRPSLLSDRLDRLDRLDSLGFTTTRRHSHLSGLRSPFSHESLGFTLIALIARARKSLGERCWWRSRQGAAQSAIRNPQSAIHMIALIALIHTRRNNLRYPYHVLSSQQHSVAAASSPLILPRPHPFPPPLPKKP
jgi:hypothetical protein